MEYYVHTCIPIPLYVHNFQYYVPLEKYITLLMFCRNAKWFIEVY